MKTIPKAKKISSVVMISVIKEIELRTDSRINLRNLFDLKWLLRRVIGQK